MYGPNRGYLQLISIIDPCEKFDGVRRDQGNKKDVCCAKTCGTCGGADCSQLPGGEYNCCVGKIRQSGKICGGVQKAPCQLKGKTSF